MNLAQKEVGKISTALGVAGVIGLVMFGYYSTGIYLNLKRIKRENMEIDRLKSEKDSKLKNHTKE